MEELSDKKLIILYLKKREGKALEILINRYLKPIYNFIFRLTNDQEEAEDFTIETFLKMWKNLRRFNLKKNFRGWLFTVAKNTTFDFFRKKKEYSFKDLSFFDENFEEKIPSEVSLEEEINQNYNLKILEEEIRKLPLHYRVVLFLRYNDHLSLPEISEILEKPLNTIKSWHFRALKILKTNISQKFDN